jgi:hypothetical protein
LQTEEEKEDFSDFQQAAAKKILEKLFELSDLTSPVKCGGLTVGARNAVRGKEEREISFSFGCGEKKEEI